MPASSPVIAAVRVLCVQEVQHGDPLVLLAAHLLLDLAAEAAAGADASAGPVPPQRPFLLECIVLLEAGRAESGYNYQFTLLLMRVYLAVGAFVPAVDLFEKLDVKHVMLDSLTYLILDDAVRFGFFDEARSVCAVSAPHVPITASTPRSIPRALAHPSASLTSSIACVVYRL